MITISKGNIDRYTRGKGLFTDAKIEKGTWLFGAHDSRLFGFINHSCDPNCSIGRSMHRYWVRAEDDILPEEELTIDYNKIPFLCQPLEFDCQCGFEYCRGHIKL